MVEMYLSSVLLLLLCLLFTAKSVAADNVVTNEKYNAVSMWNNCIGAKPGVLWRYNNISIVPITDNICDFEVTIHSIAGMKCTHTFTVC